MDPSLFECYIKPFPRQCRCPKDWDYTLPKKSNKAMQGKISASSQVGNWIAHLTYTLNLKKINSIFISMTDPITVYGIKKILNFRCTCDTIFEY